MTIYSLFIFGRPPKNKKDDPVCLYSCGWNNAKVADNPEDEEHLVHGFLVSVKSFCQRISPKPKSKGLVSYRTDKYKVTYFETPTGLKFVVMSDPQCAELRSMLKEIYARIFVEFLTKNPLYELNTPIECDLFIAKVQDFVQSNPNFKT